MKKLQLSRLLMVVTIGLLAAFEGYWLNKLFNDEYRNLKKEVDVNFRDVMYKLQRRRFEKDTSIVAQTMPIQASYPISAPKNSLPASRKNSSKKATTFIYRTFTPGDEMKKINPGIIGSVNVNSSYAYRGVPPPGLIEVIMKQRAGQNDSGSRVFVKLDSTLNIDPAFKDRLNHMVSSVTVRLHKKDSSRLPVLEDSLFKIADADLYLSGKVDKARIDRIVQEVKREKQSGAAFNKVMIDMSADQATKDPSPFVRFLASNKTINDSIPVRIVDSAFKEELIKSNKKLPYTIVFQKYANGNARKADFETDSTDAVITSKVFVGFNTPYSYQAAFGNAGPFVLKKMGVQIGGSVLLLLFVLISFITMYRNLMAQQRLTVIKNDFISNITHELKTPIATVNVAIEALRNFGGLQNPERTKEYLDISASELQRLSLLVDKVLKLSMFENHEITLQKESFDLKKLIEDVMLSMKLQFNKQKAITELETTGQDFLIDADKLHITSVVYNLLDNALKYSKENPHIAVKLIRHAEYFELRVNDNGVGIPDAYRKKIFEQFFRVPSGNRHDTKGYGLGLSYVNHIIRKHHGFIEVESELGKGSTFIVKIPFAEADVIDFGNGRKIIKKNFKPG